MAASKIDIFDVLIQVAHVYTVHILTDRNSKAAL